MTDCRAARPTIGLLVAWLGDKYATALASGVAEVAARRGADLVCFAGGGLDASAGYERQGNILYELVGPENVDGLIVASGTLVNDVGQERLAAYCARYHPLPIVSVSVALEGIPSVVVDTEEGVRDLISHLVTVHRSRRIGFIRGPASNDEAERRFRVYRESLAAHDLPFDPARVAQGAFTPASGAHAIGVLFGAGKGDVDAIVAANDAMGIAALEALLARGIRVPGEVALVGFDDVEEARYLTPALTTVRQPLTRQGEQAAELLFDAMERAGKADTGEPRQLDGATTIALPSELAVRGSCGCPERPSLPPPSFTGMGVMESGSAARRIDESALRRLDLDVKSQARQRLLAERRVRSLSAMTQALVQAVDLPELARVVGRWLPELAVRRCWLALYEDPAAPTSLARLLLWSDEAGRAHIDERGELFSSRELIPHAFAHRTDDRPRALVTEPLYFRDEQLGFVLFEVDPGEATICEDLREQLSGALARVRREEELGRAHAAERERARELGEAYRALQENQQMLLVQEKMASLGRLTAGLAHEMNTPLAAVRNALSELRKLRAELDASFDDDQVTRADYAQITEEIGRASELADRAASRAASFVQSIKFQTRDLGPGERHPFEAPKVIEETLTLLGHALRQGRCTVEFEPGEQAYGLHGSPTRFSQVVSNLVTNAIDASRPAGGPIRIELRASPRAGFVELRVIDSGSGIAPEILARIFEPMFTTKPFGEGTGLGLVIVHDIVTGDFGGSIEVESAPARGTTFVVTLRGRSEPRAAVPARSDVH